MQLKDYFHGEYQGRESFLENVIFPIFGEDNWDEGYDEDMLVSYHDTQKVADQIGIESIVRWGTIDIPMNPTSVYEITVDDKVQMQHNRVAVQKIIRRIMDTYSSAFMIIHYGNTDKWDWRFTFCSKGDNNKDVTDTKRYTFLLGPNQSCRTAADNFNKLMAKHGNIELDDIVKAFDVEALSDEFFAKYKAFYELFVDYLADPANGLRAKFIDTSFSHAGMKAAEIKDKEEKPMRDYVKKLLGRLVFIQFLQKKGWMGAQKDWTDGMQDFMQQLFLQATPKQQKNFLEEILKPLFEKALDTDRLNNGDLFDTGVRDLPNKGVLRIPYLNGGLFERDELDNIKCAFPAAYFGDLFEFFYEYNFTIDENDPNDAEVGVDPEMLGRIFENLLEDNKDKGAFYTPKEIVSYMCRESLIAYLTTDIEEDPAKEQIRAFMQTYDTSVLCNIDMVALDHKLREVKICDPAIGSGAFPMGLLKELYLSRMAIEGFPKAAQIKKDIIQQNIYGVDIEKGAVDIARLRFWLSLIVEEETPHALPNMDFKIMQGNSLMEKYKGLDLSNVSTLSGSIFDIELKLELEKLISRFFEATSHSVKADLRKQIIENVNSQVEAISFNKYSLRNINVLGNDQFFLWHTWFADVFKKGGFDIVIGNPPYGAKLSDTDRESLRGVYPELQFKVDTYAIFVLQALNLLRTDGICYYIIPNTLLDNLYADKIRQKLMCENRLLEVFDLSDDVFETAVVHSLIIGYQKSHVDKYEIKVRQETLNSEVTWMPASYFQSQQGCSINYRNYAYQGLLNKLEKNCVPLKDVVDIRQTIKTGNDKIYITDKRLARNFKPILRGKDICKYGYKSPDLFVDYGPHLANPIRHDIFEQPKLLIREAGAYIIATYDDKDYYIMSSLYNVTLKDNNYDLKYILALVNSSIFQFIMKKLTFEKTKGAFTKARIFHYYALPVKKLNKNQQKDLVELVDKLLKKRSGVLDFTTDVIEAQINEKIYKIYGLCPDEIRIIEED